MRVFVTGGTGFVGQEILWKLRDAGHSIRMLTRAPDANSVRKLAYRHQAETVAGSAEDFDTVRVGMADCEAVIHLAGIISETRTQSFEVTHVETTKCLVRAAEMLGIHRFIQMSALGTRSGAVTRYHQTKWLAEEIVRNSELQWTIFRPSVIYGRNDTFVNLLAKICRLSPIAVVVGNGQNKLQPISVTDVAHCFVGALGREKSVRQTFDLCGEVVLSIDEIYRLILKIGQRQRPLLHLPEPIAYVQATVMEFFSRCIGKPSPLTRDQLLMLREDNVGDPVPAMRTFDFQPETFAEGIARYLK